MRVKNMTLIDLGLLGLAAVLVVLRVFIWISEQC